MADTTRKRSRKSKLVPRKCHFDSDDEDGDLEEKQVKRFSRKPSRSSEIRDKRRRESSSSLCPITEMYTTGTFTNKMPMIHIPQLSKPTFRVSEARKPMILVSEPRKPLPMMDVSEPPMPKPMVDKSEPPMPKPMVDESEPPMAKAHVSDPPMAIKHVSESATPVINVSEAPMQINVKVEVERCDESNIPCPQKIAEQKIYVDQAAFWRKYKVKKFHLTNDFIVAAADKIKERSMDIADQILDIAVRNTTGHMLKGALQINTIQSIGIQYALDQWKDWQSKHFLRDGPLFYKCYICEDAWWFMEDFKQHIRGHATVNVALENQSYHEINIVAYENDLPPKSDIFISGKCGRCGKSYDHHSVGPKTNKLYSCHGCLKEFHTCLSLGFHVSNCPTLGVPKVRISCHICRLETQDIIDYDHLKTVHSVRSDVPIITRRCHYNTCDCCNERYINRNQHVCATLTYTRCKHCFRGFQTKFLADLHMERFFRSYQCPICDEEMDYECMKYEHMLTHSDKYAIVIKCILCVELIVFLSNTGILKHLKTAHKNNESTLSGLYTQIMIPKSCLHPYFDTFAMEDNLEVDDVESSEVDEKFITEVIPSITSDVQIKSIYDYNFPIKKVYKQDVQTDTGDNHDVQIETGDNHEDVKVKIVYNEDAQIETVYNEDSQIERVYNKDIQIETVFNNDVQIETEDNQDVQIETEDNQDVQIETGDNREDVKIKTVYKQDVQIETGDNRDVQIEAGDNQDVEIKTEVESDKEDAAEGIPSIQIKTEPVETERLPEVTVKQEPLDGSQQMEPPRYYFTHDVTVKEESDLEDDIDVYEEDIIKLDMNINNYENNEKKNNTQDTESIEFDSQVDSESDEEKLLIRSKSKLYKCTKCGYQDIHKKYKIHINNNCNKTFINAIKFRCTQCDTSFKTIGKYLSHLPLHGYQASTCPECLGEFNTQTRFVSHVMRHVKQCFVKIKAFTGDGPHHKADYQCSKCSMMVETKQFFVHWETHVNTGPTQPENKRDGISTPAVVELLARLHKRTKQCSYCLRTFTRFNECKRHHIEHLLTDAYDHKDQYKELRCQICASGFSTPEKYRQHMRDHASLPVYRCDMCDKSFSDSSNFTKHKKVHNFKVFVCDLCRKKFQSKIGLAKHLQMHMNTEPIICEICMKSFHFDSAYRKHVKYHHNKEGIGYPCVICNIRFGSLKHKWRHMWDVHQERKIIADCPICNKSFRIFSEVRAHMRNDHLIKMPCGQLRKELQI